MLYGGLSFLFLPAQIHYSFTQMCWLCGINVEKPIYYDVGTHIDGVYEKENNFLIKRGDEKFSCKTLNKNLCIGGLGSDHRMGDFIVNKRNAEEKITKIKYIFNEKYKEKNLVFLTWDNKNQKFITLDDKIMKIIL